MLVSPRVLLLKQTAPPRTYFIELGEDLARELGPCTAITSETPAGQVGGLTVIEAPAYKRGSAIARIRSWLFYFLKASWLTFRMGRRPLLFIVAQPPYLPLIGYIRSLLFHQRYVVWVDDVYPDVLVRMGRVTEGALIARAWRWLNRRMYGRASAVFTLGPHMAELVQRYTSHPVQIAATWVDAAAFPEVPKSENRFAAEHGQAEKLTVLYSGNVGLTHDLDTMIEAARRLQGQDGIGFLIIGGGPRWSEVVRAGEGLSNLTLLPFQPEEVLPYSLGTGEVAVVSLAEGLEGISMPSKTYANMAARSAIIGISRAPNDLQAVIEQHDCGLNVEPGDVDGFVSAVRRFQSDPAYVARCRANARRAAETTFSREVNVARVLNVVRPLVARRTDG